jgi:hypothetical protein
MMQDEPIRYRSRIKIITFVRVFPLARLILLNRLELREQPSHLNLLTARGNH